VLLGTCHNLKKLSLESCTVDDTVCRSIAQNKNLSVLNMSVVKGITETGLNFILSNCQDLIELNLAWTGLTKIGISQILVKKLSSDIRMLNISGCRQTLFDQDLQCLAIRCPFINDLDISDGNSLKADSVYIIVRHWRELRSLAMSRCYGIPAGAYLKLEECEKLTHLEIFGNFNDRGMEAIRNSLLGLEINKRMFSAIARPTTGVYRTSIWKERTRD